MTHLINILAHVINIVHPNTKKGAPGTEPGQKNPGFIPGASLYFLHFPANGHMAWIALPVCQNMDLLFLSIMDTGYCI